ncbi:hypothetical protein PIB30_107184, partial [Stylosanthes scabra]|nr:hypothetical protein [Stylosanthes scabra]
RKKKVAPMAPVPRRRCYHQREEREKPRLVCMWVFERERTAEGKREREPWRREKENRRERKTLLCCPPPFMKVAAINGSSIAGELFHHHRTSSSLPPPTVLHGRVMRRKRKYEALPLLNHGHRASVRRKPPPEIFKCR